MPPNNSDGNIIKRIQSEDVTILYASVSKALTSDIQTDIPKEFWGAIILQYCIMANSSNAKSEKAITNFAKHASVSAEIVKDWITAQQPCSEVDLEIIRTVLRTSKEKFSEGDLAELTAAIHISNTELERLEQENLKNNPIVLMAGRLHRYLSRITISELRGHQIDSLEHIDNFLNSKIGEQIPFSLTGEEEGTYPKVGNFFEVISATGTGKTRIFGTMAKAMNVPTLILTPRKLLNAQAKKEFCEEIGIPSQDVAILDSDQSTEERRRVLLTDSPPQYIITTYPSFNRLIETEGINFIDPNNPYYRPLVILDEVHKALGPDTIENIQKLLDNVLVAGFTATDAGTSEALFKDQSPIYNLPLVTAIERDQLCTGVRTGAIKVELSSEGEANLQKRFLSKGKAEYSPEIVRKFSLIPSVIAGVTEFHLTKPDEELGNLYEYPSIFFTEGVEAAKVGAEYYNKQAELLGIKKRAACISGYDTYYQPDPDGPPIPKTRQELIGMFNNNEIDLWNDQVLDIGFDSPNATICYSLKPTKLRHVVEQQLGRITRKQGKDYFNTYRRNKVALAINVFPEGSNPYFFGEVLGNIPAVYSREYSYPAKGEYKVQETIEIKEGIKVITNYEEMARVLSTASTWHIGFEKRPGYMLGIGDMATRARVSASKLSPIYAALGSAWDAAGEAGAQEFKAAGYKLPLVKDTAGRFGQEGFFCINGKICPDVR